MTSPQHPWSRPDAGQGSWNQQSAWGAPAPHYPAQQYPAPQHPAPQPGEARPKTAEAAFWISVVIPLLATVLAVVGYLLLLNFISTMFDATAGSGRAAPESDEVLAGLQSFLLVFFISLTVAYLVLTALWIVFGFKMRAGKNWARVVLTVFAGLWVLVSMGMLPNAGGMTAFSAGELPGGVEPPGGLIALGFAQAAVGLLGMIAFLLLAFAGPSNRYFRAVAGQGPGTAPGYPGHAGYPGAGR
ncbi:hypothetical protein IQ251_10560 [Saccharopolyspora sp. HNM0983]|uniref:Uncharacterized protein n=1 Tax=Saccharopolyspora montiporae TaxID=2781240 RepID=A0A929B7Y7_9PSEU|nr:hypothetical protein [Saccharopolyspora sp. HNM0983]MBE9374884.1 hypothetical protein [Saccharopolyspora sp. HNM0983]